MNTNVRQKAHLTSYTSSPLSSTRLSHHIPRTHLWCRFRSSAPTPQPHRVGPGTHKGILECSLSWTEEKPQEARRKVSLRHRRAPSAAMRTPSPRGKPSSRAASGPPDHPAGGMVLVAPARFSLHCLQGMFLSPSALKAYVRDPDCTEPGKRAATGNCRVLRARGSSFGTSGRAAKGHAQQEGERSRGKQWHFNLFRARGG